MIAHFQMLARYNTLANQRLYEARAGLDDEERTVIHRVLNHILLGDRIWMERFSGGGATTPPLDTIPYDDFAPLRAAREAKEFRYINNRGLLYVDPAPLALAHFFNHQTHHRGQVHAMLSQTPVKPPSLDMHRLIHPDPVQVQSLT